MRKAFVSMLLAFLPGLCLAQNESATLSGRVSDPTGAAVVGAEVVLTNVDTNVEQRTKTNSAGLYVFTGVHPGAYRVAAGSAGFKTLIKENLTLHVQDEIAENFSLSLGAVAETVTVNANDLHINTESAAVSTVVDRQFAENLPLNGRSFQTLIDLTPGVVVTSTSGSEQGQFSVNGQRADANYFMVDGVGANFGISPSNGGLAQSASGSVPGLSVLGGTNALVPVDAMEEFRVQTSTYAPEFGRSPGAQVSIVTRSGTNRFHGTLFDYFRNDVLDSNNWFANQQRLPKAAERQNDFGGVLGAPILKDKTFFFFSYEGLRLRLPQTAITTVPSLAARQSAAVSIQPFLNAYPIPNGPNLGNELAKFSGSFSNQAGLDSYSIRIDESLGSKVRLFGRYGYSSSNLIPRGSEGAFSLNTVEHISSNTQFVTAGTTWAPSSSVAADLRFNYSRSTSAASLRLDTFGGAVPPPDSLLFPAPFSRGNASFNLDVLSGVQTVWELGHAASNHQRQINLVDNLSLQKASHSFKFGADYRWISPIFDPNAYFASLIFFNAPSLAAGTPFLAFVAAARKGILDFHNFSAFAQDTWKIEPRLTLTYGLRWELNPPPSSGTGVPLLAVTGFDNLSTLALAPTGSSLWKTTYGNFAPRFGIAYQIAQPKGWETVLRGGFGVFYDLGTQGVGDGISSTGPPFGARKFVFGPAFPLTSAEAQPPTISTTVPLPFLFAFDPRLKLPYTLQWNASWNQALGTSQALAVSYVGADGRRLLQLEDALGPNPSFGEAQLSGNRATSDYHSLQVQFQRRMSKGLQALASYTWAHSIDTASTGTFSSDGFLFSGESDLLVRALGSKTNRGASDFDIRHSFSAALTYDVPSARGNALTRSILGGWSVDNIILARSASPAEVFDSSLFELFGEIANVRPDLVPGKPVYLHGAAFPGGKTLNPAAFKDPPIDPSTGLPTRQGNVGRNAVRGFGATQWDFAVRRQFTLHETLRLQFRSEFFNLLNHPNFANPIGDISNPLFGQSTRLLGQSLGGPSPGFGGLSPLYQIGGPRSMQFALKLLF
jgi:hypothetical protein